MSQFSGVYEDVWRTIFAGALHPRQQLLPEMIG
jgi:hypothetical protein